MIRWRPQGRGTTKFSTVHRTSAHAASASSTDSKRSMHREWQSVRKDQAETCWSLATMFRTSKRAKSPRFWFSVSRQVDNSCKVAEQVVQEHGSSRMWSINTRSRSGNVVACKMSKAKASKRFSSTRLKSVPSRKGLLGPAACNGGTRPSVCNSKAASCDDPRPG